MHAPPRGGERKPSLADWREELAQFVEGQEERKEEEKQREETHLDEIRRFLDSVVLPAFEDLQVELERYGLQVQVSSSDYTIDVAEGLLQFQYPGKSPVKFRVKFRAPSDHLSAYPEYVYTLPNTRERLRSTTGAFRTADGSTVQSVKEITKDEIIRQALVQVKNYIGNWGRK